MRYTSEGVPYFVDHRRRVTQWEDPRVTASAALPSLPPRRPNTPATGGAVAGNATPPSLPQRPAAGPAVPQYRRYGRHREGEPAIRGTLRCVAQAAHQRARPAQCASQRALGWARATSDYQAKVSQLRSVLPGPPPNPKLEIKVRSDGLGWNVRSDGRHVLVA